MKSTLTVHDLKFELYLTEPEIHNRVRELGEVIKEQYLGRNPLILPVLNGAFTFAADLLREINDIQCDVSFIKLASYRGTQSTGEVATLIGLDRSIKGKDIIILEDIVDSGKTISQLIQDLQQLEPASIKLATLLLKPAALAYKDFNLDYVGFEIPNSFVIGYGMDYDGFGRNLRGIYRLVEVG